METPISKSRHPSMPDTGPKCFASFMLHAFSAVLLHLSSSMLKTRNIGAYRDLLVLFTKYGRKDFRLSFDPEDVLAAETDEGGVEPDVHARAQAFAAALKKMGPTYVKFGQVVSTRPDVVPPEYIAALESLQDKVEPFSFAEVERIIEEELKVRMSKLFQDF